MKKIKKLSFTKESIRELTSERLVGVAGGRPNITRDCQTLTCAVTAESACELKCFPSHFTCSETYAC